MDHARRQKQKIITKPLRRTSFLLRRATTANWCDIGRVTIDILPDDVLLEILDHYLAKAYEYLKYEKWADTGARVSNMAICCISVTTSPESPNSLLSGKTCEGEAGCLATAAYNYTVLNQRR
jgi:hypothetical protein